MLFFIWMITRVLGAACGLIMLRALDDGLLDESLLTGALTPPPTPEARFRFLVFWTLLPEVQLSFCLALWWVGRR